MRKRRKVQRLKYILYNDPIRSAGRLFAFLIRLYTFNPILYVTICERSGHSLLSHIIITREDKKYNNAECIIIQKPQIKTKIGKAHNRHKNLSKDNNKYPYNMIIDVTKYTSMILTTYAIISSCINM